MAGAGWRQFTIGQLLTSAQVQTYLQDQAVQVHASAAARSSALGTAVSQGMVSYRSDDKALELYAGSAWTPVMQGRNAIINGGFDFWQRGTSFANPNGLYTADRYITFYDGSGATRTWSRQTFTPNEIPGQDSQFFLRLNQSVAGTGGTYSLFGNRSEDVRESANRTMTYSFWAKAAAATSVSVYFVQNFGSGGSSEVGTGATTFNLTTSWQRFTVTLVMPSISGKTVGAGSYVDVRWNLPLNTTYTIDTWGWQFEQGSVATPFQRAAGTLQGELAACQRYYQRYTDIWQAFGSAANSVAVYVTYRLMPMRAAPTSVDYSGMTVGDINNSSLTTTSIAINQANTQHAFVVFNCSGATQYRPYAAFNSGGTGYIGFSAEL